MTAPRDRAREKAESGVGGPHNVLTWAAVLVARPPAQPALPRQICTLSVCQASALVAGKVAVAGAAAEAAGGAVTPTVPGSDSHIGNVPWNRDGHYCW